MRNSELIRNGAILLFCSLLNVSMAQNLVPNPSFEEYTTCPNANYNNVVAWKRLDDHDGTPDVFNPCSTLWDSSVPDNFGGYEYAADGEGYAGLVLTSGHFNSVGTQHVWREYITAELEEPLQNGEEYQVSLQYSAGDSQYYFTNQLGIYFSATELAGPGTPLYLDTIYFGPQVVFNDSLNNRNGWLTLRKSFISWGVRNHITIGNFVGNSGTPLFAYDSTLALPVYLNEKTCYIFIDDIQVVKCDDIIGSYSVLQVGDSLSVNGSFDSYQWLDCSNSFEPILGETSQTFSPQSSGEYAVIVSNGTCSNTSACINFGFLDALEFGNEQLILSPNPVHGMLELSSLGSLSKIEHVSVYSALGELLIGPIETESSLNVNKLSQGNYLLYVEYSDINTVYRFIKE